VYIRVRAPADFQRKANLRLERLIPGTLDLLSVDVDESPLTDRYCSASYINVAFLALSYVSSRSLEFSNVPRWVSNLMRDSPNCICIPGHKVTRIAYLYIPRTFDKRVVWKDEKQNTHRANSSATTDGCSVSNELILTKGCPGSSNRCRSCARKQVCKNYQLNETQKRRTPCTDESAALGIRGGIIEFQGKLPGKIADRYKSARTCTARRNDRGRFRRYRYCPIARPTILGFLCSAFSLPPRTICRSKGREGKEKKSAKSRRRAIRDATRGVARTHRQRGVLRGVLASTVRSSSIRSRCPLRSMPIAVPELLSRSCVTCYSKSSDFSQAEIPRRRQQPRRVALPAPFTRSL